MKNEPENFWEGATFMPHDQPSRSELLRERVWKASEAAFVVFGLKLAVKEKELYLKTGFAKFFEAFKSLPPQERRKIIEWPPFRIWFMRTARADCSQLELEGELAELQGMLTRFERAQREPCVISFGESSIGISRFDVDPLIAKASSPEYVFPDDRRQREFDESVAYPSSFFVDMVMVALERIRRAWPEAHRDFFKFVRVVVDMIDGDFTSYSGANHRGVIFVSTDNSPLVALEEYLMHEFGHQVLYNVMQLDQLVLTNNKQRFKMPWSGNERDLSGYLHAFYIYILLARYLERVKGRSRREQRRIAARSSYITKGLILACRELESTAGFTPRGQHLFQNLKMEVDDLLRSAGRNGADPQPAWTAIAAKR